MGWFGSAIFASKCWRRNLTTMTMIGEALHQLQPTSNTKATDLLHILTSNDQVTLVACIQSARGVARVASMVSTRIPDLERLHMNRLQVLGKKHQRLSYTLPSAVASTKMIEM